MNIRYIFSRPYRKHNPRGKALDVTCKIILYLHGICMKNFLKHIKGGCHNLLFLIFTISTGGIGIGVKIFKNICLLQKIHRKFYLHFFRIKILFYLHVPNNQILLHFSAPNKQILRHFDVPNSQILLHFGVPYNSSMNISS